MRQKQVACSVSVPPATDDDVLVCRERMRSCTKEDRQLFFDYMACMDAQPVCSPTAMGSFYSSGCSVKLATLSAGCRNFSRASEPGTDDTPPVLPAANTTPYNNAPVAVISPISTLFVGLPVRLDGSSSSDRDNDALTFTWRLIARPPGSAATLSGSTAFASLTADVAGLYEIGLIANDGRENSDEAVMGASAVVVVGDARALSYRVVDAEVSLPLDRVIAVSASPHKLHILTPSTGADTTVDLSLTPACVSVGPDGLFAAVGHDGWISYVDLSQAKVVATYAIPTDVYDVVLAGNGYVYASPRQDQWENIHHVRLVDGVTGKGTHSVYAGGRIKLHPSGAALYFADTGLSPADIERHSIVSGAAELVSDSPYHGDYSMCGNLWLSHDGERIFTACGNVFRSSDVEANDMLYNGSLPNDEADAAVYAWVDHHANRVAALQTARRSYWDAEPSNTSLDTRIKIFDYQFLSEERAIQLPPLLLDGAYHSLHGDFVFFSADGASLYLIAHIAESAGVLNNFALVAVPL